MQFKISLANLQFLWFVQTAVKIFIMGAGTSPLGVDRANDFVMLSATKAAKWMPSDDPSFVAASENDPMWSRAIAMADIAIDGLHAVSHKAHIYGCWHMAASARAVRDAAAELGVDVHDCSNRDKYQKGLSTPA